MTRYRIRLEIVLVTPTVEIEPITGELDLVVQYDDRRLGGEWATALVERYCRHSSRRELRFFERIPRK